MLVVHHIDENRNNNNHENLIWLCYNCHHLVHNYPDEKAKLNQTLKNAKN
jgi:predicted HNH restriction endonuclease